ncbi:PAS domain S-box protein [Rummeliibacillus pycnus]|uniref:PAS domain S-box protein n=1 Tax=Rummeliibacillus pycnus TaxID=101070 RepID=UPI000C9C1259|nr:PAS domain S-box protein [Rummeliibacillus pycnus]
MSEDFITREQFNALIKTNKGFVFLMELVENKFKYIYINQTAEMVFKTNPEGEFLDNVIHSDVRNTIEENYRKAIHTKQQVTYRDFYLFSENGYTNETVCTPIFYGERTYLLAITNDISEQKTLEEKSVFLQSLFEDKIDPIVILLKDFTIYEVNPIFNKLFKFSLNKNQNFMDSDFMDTENNQKYLQYIEKTFNGKGSSSVIFTHKIKENETGTFLVSFSPVYMDHNVIAICIQWQELKSAVQLKNDLIETTLLLDSYRDALNIAANICITDVNGVIEYVNAGFEKQTQYSSVELVGQTNAILNSREHSKEYYKKLWDCILNGEIWRGEMCNRTKYGRTFWADTTIVPIKNAKGEITNFLAISFDISEKKSIITNLRNVEKLFRLITEHTNDLIVITSEDGIILYISPNHEARLGYDQEELLGKFFSEILAPASSDLLNQEINMIIEDFGNLKTELEVIAKNGQRFWVEAQVSAVNDSERRGIKQFVTVAREITERKELEEKLRFLAYHDSLTLLPNRRYLLERFEDIAHTADSSNSSIAILFIDGDNFKRINDVYGHDVGDEFIRKFGKALSSSLRDSDIIARIGGDEFVVILTKMSKNKIKRKKQIEQTIARIQKILRVGWTIGKNYFSPTSSIGVSCYPEDGTEISLLLDKADVALYYAKKISGKDSYHFACK